MRRAFLGALLGAALASYGVAEAQPSIPSAKDKARVKGKMKDFDKEFSKSERTILDEDSKAKAQMKAAEAEKAKREAKSMEGRVKGQLDKPEAGKGQGAGKDDPGQGKGVGKALDKGNGRGGDKDGHGPSTPQVRAERRSHVLAEAKRRRENREERARTQREESQRRIEGAKGDAKAKAAQELEHHARRIARLDRIAELAAEANDDKGSERVVELIGKENARHEAKMARILSEGAAESETAEEVTK